MSEITFEIVKIVVCAAVSILAVLLWKVVVPYIKVLTLSEEQLLLLDTVKKAVEATEQKIKESGQGEAKKTQVLASVSHWLSEKNIHITEEQLDILVEAAVFAMNKEKNRALEKEQAIEKKE